MLGMQINSPTAIDGVLKIEQKLCAITRRSSKRISEVSRSPLQMFVRPFILSIYHSRWGNIQYRGWNPEKAVEDYYNRIRDREKNYEPVEETDWPFIRIINVSLRYLSSTGVQTLTGCHRLVKR
jgi:hypothetical protein